MYSVSEKHKSINILCCVYARDSEYSISTHLSRGVEYGIQIYLIFSRLRESSAVLICSASSRKF